VPAHGVRMLRMWPVEAPPPPPQPPSPPSPPPSPVRPPACPSGFTQHASGYWRNTDPCPQPEGPGEPCVEDRTNATVPLCGTKCTTIGKSCVGFEVYMVGLPPAERACYVFLQELKPPFAADPVAFTCIRA
jgi:hypothetical protein